MDYERQGCCAVKVETGSLITAAHMNACVYNEPAITTVASCEGCGSRAVERSRERLQCAHCGSSRRELEPAVLRERDDAAECFAMISAGVISVNEARRMRMLWNEISDYKLPITVLPEGVEVTTFGDTRRRFVDA